MLRKKFLTVFSLSFALHLLFTSGSENAATTTTIRRITLTSEAALNLNPFLSGDGRVLAFESTEDLANAGGQGFHSLRADLEVDSFTQMGLSRAVTPALSQDGSWIVFASKDNPLGTNPDGNSEIFLYRQSTLTQLTNTIADNESRRTADGNFQPSISDDGRFVAFSSNRDLTGQNNDHNFEIYLFDTNADVLRQVTNSSSAEESTSAKISGNGNMIAFLRDTKANCELVLQSRVEPDSARVVAQNVVGLTLAYGRAISDDGLRVVYAAEMEPNLSQLFLWDGRNDVTRQLTQLGSFGEDVALQGSISGDGLRVAFATRRNPNGDNPDHSVELYVIDIPSGQIESVTSAPANATAEVISSLNDDGSLVAFHFPRVLVGAVSSSSFANNSEVFVATTTARPIFGPLSVANGASHGHEQTNPVSLAPASIAVATGQALAHITQEAQRRNDKTFPTSVAGTSVSVNGRSAQILFVSPTQVNFVVPATIEVGFAEVVVTNTDGFRSRDTLLVSPTAPGLFTTNGEGFGEGVALNADTLQAGPFDPSSGMLRLTIFATGVRNAVNISVRARNHSLTVESVNASPDFPGLDEIHLLMPAAFRGVGAVELFVRADERDSNAVELVVAGTTTRDLLINEVLADPPDGLAGDANHDGLRSSSADEFVELVNAGTATNISEWTIRTRSLGGTNETVRHTFASGTILLAGEVLVVFGGGDFDPTNPIFGCAEVTKTSSSGLSLVNGGLTLILRDATGGLVTEFTYGDAVGLEGDNNQSLTRSPDLSGSFVQHTVVAGASNRRFSPGLRTDGTPLTQCVGYLDQITLSSLLTMINVGDVTSLVAQPIDNYGRSLPGIAVTFTSDNLSVATIDAVVVDEAAGTFTATITGHNAGTVHIGAEASAGNRTVTARMTVTVLTPSSPASIVINQIYGGGNNSGATFQNDFVELFNRGASTVDFSVTPYSLQYASASGSFTNANKLDLNLGTIAPGQFFLVRLAGGVTNGTALPTADASSAGINLSSSDGKVAVVIGTTLLAGSGCPLNTTTADFVGYGSANCAEGTATGSLNATRSARRINRCSDTNSNATDFAVLNNPPLPQNSAVAPAPCP